MWKLLIWVFIVTWSEQGWKYALIFKDKKMLAKILMCRCNTDKCHQEQNEYVVTKWTLS